jgi:hypothetical protein
MAEKKHKAMICISKCGPCFGGILVSDNCNANTKSYTQLGHVYTNNTKLDGGVVCTGSQKFQVKEIEVFEITP